MAEDTNQTPPAADGAQGGEAPAEGAAAAPKKKKMLLIISVAVAVVGIAVAVGVVFLMGGDGEKKAEESHSEVPQLALVEVPEFNLSLMGGEGEPQHYIKMKTAVELVKAEDLAAAGALLPKLQDDWGGFLRQMRMSDLQGSANLHRLKEGLLRRANQSLTPVEVKAVYIKELLIQ